MIGFSISPVVTTKPAPPTAMPSLAEPSVKMLYLASSSRAYCKAASRIREAPTHSRQSLLGRGKQCQVRPLGQGQTLKLVSGILLNEFRSVLLVRSSALCLKNFLLFSLFGAFSFRARFRGWFEGSLRALTIAFFANHNIGHCLHRCTA